MEASNPQSDSVGPSPALKAAKAGVSKMLAGLQGMKEVETLISSKLTSDAELLETIPAYLLGLGGKRIRPAMTLLVSRAFGSKSVEFPVAEVIDVAAGIELIHMATLLHDDIIDKSPLRRHKQSPFLKFGLGNSLLAGDFLLVRAFSLCARLDRYVIDATEQACIELTEGEILETASRI
jgi:geranylgeranyl pyrophosphate synthase